MDSAMCIQDTENYCIMCQIMEHIMLSQIIKHMDRLGLLTERWFGFHKLQ